MGYQSGEFTKQSKRLPANLWDLRIESSYDIIDFTCLDRQPRNTSEALSNAEFGAQGSARTQIESSSLLSGVSVSS